MMMMVWESMWRGVSIVQTCDLVRRNAWSSCLAAHFGIMTPFSAEPLKQQELRALITILVNFKLSRLTASLPTFSQPSSWPSDQKWWAHRAAVQHQRREIQTHRTEERRRWIHPHGAQRRQETWLSGTASPKLNKKRPWQLDLCAENQKARFWQVFWNLGRGDLDHSIPVPKRSCERDFIPTTPVGTALYTVTVWGSQLDNDSHMYWRT